MFTLASTRNDTSITLDACRALAAQMVCCGHALVFFGVGDAVRPPHIPLMQNIGVLLFFVMSGFLISATLFRKSAAPEYGFKQYFIDRFARIYSGLLPALAFIVVVDGLVIQQSGDPTISRSYDLKTLIANLLMNVGYRGIFPNFMPREAFGSASPLWTLAIEWHIYMFVGAAFFIFIRRGSLYLLIPLLLFFGQTPVRYILGSTHGNGVGTGLFALWLGGAAIYVVLSRYIPPLWASAALLVASTALYAFGIVPGAEYDLATYPALVVVVGSLIAVTQRTAVIGRATAIRIAADYSFTLYLIHHTMMFAVVTLVPGAQGWLWFFAVVAAANAAAYAIACLCEMRHRKFAAWIAVLWSRTKPEMATAPERPR
jgi:peptidoglycan/LPS O-acetylase OafA/YrhL